MIKKVDLFITIRDTMSEDEIIHVNKKRVNILENISDSQLQAANLIYNQKSNVDICCSDNIIPLIVMAKNGPSKYICILPSDTFIRIFKAKLRKYYFQNVSIISSCDDDYIIDILYDKYYIILTTFLCVDRLSNIMKQTKQRAEITFSMCTELNSDCFGRTVILRTHNETLSKDDIVCPLDVIDGILHTKEKRHELYGKVAGGSGSIRPEEFQRKSIIDGTKRPCKPTNTRINWRKNELCNIDKPLMGLDGFDYTENFDGIQMLNNKVIWINMKSVVGQGGSQTRTLRECYFFIEHQLNLLLSGGVYNYFANIFDGDEACKRLKQFNYLIQLPKYENIKKYVYVGDLKGYFVWIKSII